VSAKPCPNISFHRYSARDLARFFVNTKGNKRVYYDLVLSGDLSSMKSWCGFYGWT